MPLSSSNNPTAPDGLVRPAEWHEGLWDPKNLGPEGTGTEERAEEGYAVKFFSGRARKALQNDHVHAKGDGEFIQEFTSINSGAASPERTWDSSVSLR
ncbi:hypothetical protein Enr13x_57850 [Stieleria neptunia]|uniref:Uncharacterized protein n=1 Tax=Stieleria neptunia TaxID=2527979 RepID=A0A518HYF8_9BACT|nr:hypothetical protein Enr13x_57850 [Stieleria neptunia]